MVELQGFVDVEISHPPEPVAPLSPGARRPSPANVARGTAFLAVTRTAGVSPSDLRGSGRGVRCGDSRGGAASSCWAYLDAPTTRRGAVAVVAGPRRSERETPSAAGRGPQGCRCRPGPPRHRTRRAPTGRRTPPDTRGPPRPPGRRAPPPPSAPARTAPDARAAPRRRRRPRWRGSGRRRVPGRRPDGPIPGWSTRETSTASAPSPAATRSSPARSEVPMPSAHSGLSTSTHPASSARSRTSSREAPRTTWTGAQPPSRSARTACSTSGLPS